MGKELGAPGEEGAEIIDIFPSTDSRASIPEAVASGMTSNELNFLAMRGHLQPARKHFETSPLMDRAGVLEQEDEIPRITTLADLERETIARMSLAIVAAARKGARKARKQRKD